MLKKTCFILAIVASLFMLTLTAQAAKYPNKPVHLVVPWAAGGGTDVIARALADSMRPIAGVPIVVDNITGAAGSAGNRAVANAAPDGYTVLFNGDTDILGAITMVQGGYDLDSFTYIGGVFYSPTWILSNAKAGITDINDFLAKAKANPQKLILASTTPSGAQMVMATAIHSATGAPFRIIPYQGGSDMLKALLSNQVEAGIIHAPVMLEEVKAGDIRVIATGGSLAKSSYEPLRNMKTLEEMGIPVSMGIYRGVMVPKATPPDVVKQLTEIVKKAAESPEFVAFGERFGFAPQWLDGPEYEKNMRAQLSQFGDVKK
jgi:tripartite-type tricarboxylate transporter receptor subunit TctC